MKINRVGVDLAKNVFQLHGADHKIRLSEAASDPTETLMPVLNLSRIVHFVRLHTFVMCSTFR
jgi:hypothetical protein